ncbi:hypothetical protein HJC23_000824 [Cyclotella cryptica]|uniref:Uncharacterized protein n=1 Tax=Cyclotella cryptica TaxID=29204 RepID=A0ABD3Q7D6_9STRA|eukprot:CCRYP_008482-RA/>CCRYP_008482-RA protein AED:0.00 eAED:0.00 QI:198/1/1/1/1/1/2/31/614
MKLATRSLPRNKLCYIPHDSTEVIQPSKMWIQSGAFGLHAIATQDMPAGTVILQCLPLAHSLLAPPGVSPSEDDGVHDNEGKRRRCTRCFVREGDRASCRDGVAKKLMRCSKCKIAYYCSRSCQAEDWSTQHRPECQYYAKRRKDTSTKMIATSAEEDAIPLLLRTFASLTHMQSNSRSLCSATRWNIIDLQKTNLYKPEIISCGINHFSALAVPPEYLSASGTLCNSSNNSAMRLAKEIMTSIVTTKNVKSESSDAATSVWGYNENTYFENKAATCINLDRSIQRTLHAFQKNNFGIVDSLHSSIGEGVYPCAALLNHSCYPNCILRYELGIPYENSSTMSYHPPILQIVACRDIRKGDELTHSYVDLALPTPERQSRLLQTHGFECRCKRCSNECSLQLPESMGDWKLWPLEQKIKSWTLTTLKRDDEKETINIVLDSALTGRNNLESSTEYNNLIQRSRKFQEQATHCMLEGDSSGELWNLHKAIELFEAFGREISPFHFQLYSIRCSYLSALLANGDIPQAAEQCEHIVSFLVVAFSHIQNHPLLGLQLYTLGDLYNATADCGETFQGSSSLNLREMALLTYSWAKDVMLITHGPNNIMVQLLGENLTTG